MFKTRVTEMLRIKYPILQGAMHLISRAELVAAVSNAGGLGILASTTFPTAKELVAEIQKTRSLTDKPFGVNINLFPTMRPVNLEGYIDALIDEDVSVVETSGRNPEPYMDRFKKGNVTVIHKVARVKDAVSAERAGVDAVSIVGFEAGGHPGMDNITSMVHIPLTVDAVKIPVIAGGGIADSRGFVAALALGAEGVVVGTRFMATYECPVHPKVKEWLINANATDTMIIERSIKNASRVMRNAAAEKALELESKGVSLEELLPVVSGERTKEVYEKGDLDAGVVHCGEVVGLIHDVVSVKDVVDDVVTIPPDLGHRLLGIFTEKRQVRLRL
jgi:nitronate monooxygenase